MQIADAQDPGFRPRNTGQRWRRNDLDDLGHRGEDLEGTKPHHHPLGLAARRDLAGATGPRIDRAQEIKRGGFIAHVLSPPAI